MIYSGTPKLAEQVGLYTLGRRGSLDMSPRNKPTPVLVLLPHQNKSPARYQSLSTALRRACYVATGHIDACLIYVNFSIALELKP